MEIDDVRNSRILTLLIMIMLMTVNITTVNAGDDDGGDDQSVTLIRPVGGEIYTVGYELDILFSNTGLAEILVELKLDSDSEWSTLGTKSTEPDTSSWWTWNVSDHPSTTAQVRVSSTSNPEIYDMGDHFTIIEQTDDDTQLEPIPFESKSSGCVGGTSVNMALKSSALTEWANLGVPPYMNSGEPDWNSATTPLSQTSVPPSTSSDWSLARVQHNTPYFINSATVYTYTGSTTSPGGSEYVWVDNTQNIQWSTGHGTTHDHDFNGMVGMFVFRHDFQIPTDAYDFEFAALANADDYFVKDPYLGTSDFSIRVTSDLTTPVTDFFPSPSNTHPSSSFAGHIGSAVVTAPIQFSMGIQQTYNQETDLSFVLFVENIRMMGALGYHLTVKYCVPPANSTPPPQINLPSTGVQSYECGKKYDGGVLSVSSETDTGYRIPLGSGPASWHQTGTASGSYFNPPGGSNAWQFADNKWTAGGPVMHHWPATPAPYGYVTTGELLPSGADDSEWVWNGQYTKEYGIHEFGQLVSLSSMNIPPGVQITDMDAVVYFSADNMLLTVNTATADELTNFGLFHADLNALTSTLSPYQHQRNVFRTGVTMNGGYSPFDVLRPITDPATGQPPSHINEILFKIKAMDIDNPQFANTGILHNVDPAGIRFAILVCVAWEAPPVSVVSVKCTEEETELMSGENQTEIRALQRDLQGMTTWTQGSSISQGVTTPASFSPLPWSDMLVLSYKNQGQQGVTNPNNPTYVWLNQELHIGGGNGFYHTPGGPNSFYPFTPAWSSQTWQQGCVFSHAYRSWDWHPLTSQPSTSSCNGAVVNNNGVSNVNMYSGHAGPSSDWLMYGAYGTGIEDAHNAPAGLKEVRIPFTIPQDAEPGSVSIVGSIGLAADMISTQGAAYVYPACYSQNSICPEDALYPEFTHGVSIVSQGNPTVELEMLSADPTTTYRQADNHNDGVPLLYNTVQTPGDYWLKFYISTDAVPAVHPDGRENPPTYATWFTGPTGITEWIVIDATPKPQTLPFALNWAFDVEYEVCTVTIVTTGGGGGSGSGSGIPFISPITVMMMVAIAAFAVARRNGNETQEHDESSV